MTTIRCPLARSHRAPGARSAPKPALAALAALVLAALLALPAAAQEPPAPAESSSSALSWRRGADLPRRLAGQAVGSSHGTLIVAGGTDFPTPLFDGGSKVWLDDVYVLEPASAQWRALDRLPHPLAYAAVATLGNRMLIAGGSDRQRHYASAFTLEWAGGRVVRRPLPPLPSPLAMAGAAVIGQTLFVVGGQHRPDDTDALASVWALDLTSSAPAWRTLPPIPGPGRILPVVAAQQGRLHVISGAALQRAPGGTPSRRYLRDAYAWSPYDGWRRLADVPRPVVAAPAAPFGQSHILVFGGDDGSQAGRIEELKDRHPGFSRDVLAYHTITDTWTTAGRMPTGLVTTHAVTRGDTVLIAGGEDRPGHRSAAVFRGQLAPTSRPFALLDYLVLVAYFVPLLLIGRHFSTKNESTEDFFLGGRRVPWWAAGLSIYGTQLSAITFLAIPAKAYAEDWVFLLANLCILAVAPLVVWFYLPFFRALPITTAYEYLEQRFGLAVRLAGSLAFIVLQAARMAIVLFLPALALEAVTGLDIYLSILLMGLLCTAYTLQGGMRAVIWTDVLQVVTLLGAAIVSLVLVVGYVDGGLGTVVRIASEHGKLHMFTWSWDATVTSVWVVVIGNTLANLVPYTADQAVIQRYLTTSNERQAARAIWTAGVLTLPTSLLFFGVGTALYVFYRTHPSLLHPAVATDATFAWFIGRQLPVGVSGLVVAGVFAAAMSTLSSSINSITAALVTDFYGRFRASATEAARMRLARRLTILVGVGGTASALIMATWNIQSLWDLFLQSMGLFGGGLAGVFALGIFTRRAHGAGALVGLVASALILHLVQQRTAVHFLLYAAIGGATCMIVGYVTSLVIPATRPALDGLTVFTRKRNRVPFRGQKESRPLSGVARPRKGTRFLFRRFLFCLALASTTLAASSDAPAQTDVYVAGRDGYHTYRIPSVIATPRGTLLAFAEARREGKGDAGDIDLVLKRSTDGGKSWSAMRVIGDNGPNTFGNPCPVIDRRTGTVWLLTTQNLGEDSEEEIIEQTGRASRTVWVMHSRDDGVTWSTPVEITKSVKRPEWTWYATGPGVGIQTRSGRLVIPANHAVAGTGTHRSHVFFSDDHGRTWQLGGHSAPGTNESQVVQLTDGRLMLNMRNHPRKPENFRAVAFSHDEGRTFTEPIHDRSLVEPPAQASLLRVATAGADRDRLLFANPASTKRERMTVRLSYDEGRTWPVSRVIHGGPAAYSSLVVLPDGTIGLLYERGDEQPYERLTFARFSLSWLQNRGQASGVRGQ